MTLAAVLVAAAVGVVAMQCTPRNRESFACAETPTVWIKRPIDAAVPFPPGYGNWFTNADRSILASAWWTEQNARRPLAGHGIKMGWFRPAGAELQIVGKRLDANAPPLVADIPCCYP